MLKEFLKKYLLFYSLANLLFVKQWLILFENSSTFLFESVSAYRATFLSIHILIVLFSFVLYLIHYFFSKSKHFEILFLVFLLFFEFFVLNNFRLSRVLPRDEMKGLAVVCFLLINFVFFKIRSPKKMVEMLGLLALPFAFLTALRSMDRLIHLFPEKNYKEVLTRRNGKKPKVFYFLFDMWDYHVTFENQKTKSFMPFLQELKKSTVSATQSLPPAFWTPLSISSSLYGASIQGISSQMGKQQFLLKTCGMGEVRHHDLISVFEELKTSHHKKVAAVGWHLPYCQMFGVDLDYCYRLSLFHRLKMPFDQDLVVSLKHQLLELSWVRNYQPEIFQKNYEEYSRLTENLIRNPNLDFVFIHYSFPHEPFKYDSFQKKWKRESSRPLDYWDNLGLVDETLKKIKAWMTLAGIWDESTILFTSDHGVFRTKLNKNHKKVLVDENYNEIETENFSDYDFRIPFLLKFPHQKNGFSTAAPYNSVLNKELVLGLMNQTIQSPADFEKWVIQKQPEVEKAKVCLNSYNQDENFH